MGYYHSTYHFFGAHVPAELFKGRHLWEEEERLDQVIKDAGLSGTGVGHLSAGSYDNDFLFLVVSDKNESLETKLGAFSVDPASDPEPREWAALLIQTAQAAGYDLSGFGIIGWYTVPDLS